MPDKKTAILAKKQVKNYLFKNPLIIFTHF